MLCATTDTTNAIPATASLLGITWQPCAARVLELCIKSALNAQQQEKKLISLVHKIASFFNNFSLGLKCLKKHQLEKDFENPVQHFIL